ncbi:magnesium transporter MRS2-3-like isoform X1 [Salvia hispanica]|uniref:magnesium transporter MRS2-3-like isoform X1 n=1 Tax=Salvia hispanica TaxID=49212 RepID=UPI0020097B14|nr:magnesium transporter MRS2-3-like isoform X1 [Salvia hispanica]
MLESVRAKYPGGRKKGGWLVVKSTGAVEEVGKQAVMQRTGLPSRDLRMLDTALSYPSAIMGRDEAIVVNLESISCIITSTQMIFLNSKHPYLTSFINNMQQLFRHRHDFYTTKEAPMDQTDDQENVILPFEFFALEACLQATCKSLDEEQATRLEQEAHPALDKLTSKISNLNLDWVRVIKTRLVAITGRVQKVRDELEHLLDDDQDMAQMYLTEKLEDDEEEDVRPNLEELEMILEAYFVEMEGTLNKLLNLREMVESREEYIKTMLDVKQNQSLQTQVVINTTSLAVGTLIVLTGVFGMNIGIEMFDPTKYGTSDFLWTVGGGTMASVFCCVVAVIWYKSQGLLD